MMRCLTLLILSTGLLLGCAPEVPEEVVPVPSVVPPVRRAPPRPAVRPAQPVEARPQAEPEPPAGTWRVARDGVVGCAQRAALDVLRRAADDGAPRLLAEARSSGGCRTTFRVNEWVLEAAEGEVVRLRMTNGASLTLWFQRSEVVAP